MLDKQYTIYCIFKGEKDPLKMSLILTNEKDPPKNDFDTLENSSLAYMQHFPMYMQYFMIYFGKF